MKGISRTFPSMQNQYRICNPVLILQSGKAVLRETPASWVRTLIDITQLLSPARRYAATVIERKLPLRYRTGFNHERREPSVPRRGRRKSTVNKHFHRFFCRLPFAWKGREPAPHLMAVSFHRRVFPGSSGFPASLRNEEKIYCIRNRS